MSNSLRPRIGPCLTACIAWCFVLCSPFSSHIFYLPVEPFPQRTLVLVQRPLHRILFCSIPISDSLCARKFCSRLLLIGKSADKERGRRLEWPSSRPFLRDTRHAVNRGYFFQPMVASKAQEGAGMGDRHIQAHKIKIMESFKGVQNVRFIRSLLSTLISINLSTLVL